jgi:hypothetical protein
MKRSPLIVIAALVAAALVAPATSLAEGTVRIQETNGTIKMYRAVSLRLNGQTLKITSRDHAGTLVLDQAACTYVDGLRRCYPSQFVLTQHGVHYISLRRGTVYINASGAAHQLRHSSKMVPPHSVLALLETQHGTYISVTGQLDEDQP